MATHAPISTYYDYASIVDAVNSGRHREVIGGLWNEIGDLQLSFLLSQGLRPHHKLLDIGCGSLRAGVRFVRYLDRGNYYGTDLNFALLHAGYAREIVPAGLAKKLPYENLICDGEFDFSWCEAPFDFAIAQSVFTHLPLDRIGICLRRLHPVMKPGAGFYATIFEVAEGDPVSEPHKHSGGIVTYGTRDPYHYHFSEILLCCHDLPWIAESIGDWHHPRSQHMVRFVKAG